MLEYIIKQYKYNEFRILLATVWLIAFYGIFRMFVDISWWWLVFSYSVSKIITAFGISLAQHRYFSHRSFDTTPTKEKILAWFTILSCTGSPIQFARSHRHHHKVADTDRDWHSPWIDGPLKVALGIWEFRSLSWFMAKGGMTPRDLIANPTVRQVHDYYYIVWYLLLLVTALIDWRITVYVIALPAMLSHYDYHIFTSWLAHSWGTKKYDTNDQSRNNPKVYFVQAGECYHNNHHAYPFLYDFGIKENEPDWIARFIERFLAIDGPNTKRGKIKRG